VRGHRYSLLSTAVAHKRGEEYGSSAREMKDSRGWQTGHEERATGREMSRRKEGFSRASGGGVGWGGVGGGGGGGGGGVMVFEVLWRKCWGCLLFWGSVCLGGEWG